MNNEKTEHPTHFANIQALRAVAVLLVLVLHTYAVEGKYFTKHAVPEILGIYGGCGVDLFFVISGFVMTTITRGQFGSGKMALIFLQRRLLRIYPIYWFYSLIVLIVMLVMPQWVNSSQENKIDALSSLLLLPTDALPLLIQGWTLTYEMFFYVVFAGLIAWLPERLFPVVLIAWSGLLCAFAYFLTWADYASPVLDVISDPLVLEFIAGCFCALWWRRIHVRQAVMCIVVGILFLVVVSLAGGQIGLDTVIQWRTLTFGFPAFLFVIAAASLEGHCRFTAPRLFCLLGDASYSIYLSHVLSISAVGRLYQRFAPTALPSVCGTLLCIFIALVAGYVSYKLIEQPVNLFLKRAASTTN